MKPDDAATASHDNTSETGHGHAQELNELPDTYGENMVVVLPVSPDKVHAFWEISPDEPKGNNKQDAGNGEGQPVLRLHETGGPPSESNQESLSFDVPAEPGIKSKYVNLKEPGKSFQAEIGHETKEGEFIPTAQSNVAETPRPLPMPEKAMTETSFAEPSQHQPRHSGIIPLAHRDSKPFSEPFIEQPSLAPSQESMLEPESFPTTVLEHQRVTEGDASLSTAETELLLIERRTAIFRHLSEAVPLAKTESELVSGQVRYQTGQADQTGQTGRAGQSSRPAEIHREKDLTEISEQKFVAGISS